MRNRHLVPDISIPEDASIAAAVSAIEKSGGEIALVVTASGHLAGTITDGDVRRSILRGLTLGAAAADVMNPAPRTVPDGAATSEIAAAMRAANVAQMPVVAPDGRVLDIVFSRDLSADRADPELARHRVVIMAGGLGTRLLPATRNLPKPMVDVGGRPILATIVERLREQGVCRITLCLNHLAEMIRDHFGDGSRFGVEIDYVREEKRLGTAGALSLLGPQERPIIVMNGDILTTARFDRLLAFHVEHDALATMGLNSYRTEFPYGVVEVENWHITGFSEKPILEFFINAGIYVVGPEALELVPKDSYFDMPSLFDLIPQERRVAFPIHEHWADIGRHEDLERAGREFARTGGTAATGL